MIKNSLGIYLHQPGPKDLSDSSRAIKLMQGDTATDYRNVAFYLTDKHVLCNSFRAYLIYFASWEAFLSPFFIK